MSRHGREIEIVLCPGGLPRRPRRWQPMPASAAALKLAEVALKPIGLDILVPLTEARRGMIHLRTREAQRWVFSLWMRGDELSAVIRAFGPGLADDRQSWCDWEGQEPLELLQPGEFVILEKLINSLPM